MKKEKSYKEYLEAVKLDHNAILDVPKELWTNELCLEAVKRDYSALYYLEEKHLSKDICVEAYTKSPSSIRYVRKELRQLFMNYINK